MHGVTTDGCVYGAAAKSSRVVGSRRWTATEIVSSCSALETALDTACTGKVEARDGFANGELRPTEVAGCLETALDGSEGGALLKAGMGVLVSMISSATVAIGGWCSQDAEVYPLLLGPRGGIA